MAGLGHPSSTPLRTLISQAGLADMYEDVERRLDEFFHSYKIEPCPSGKRVELRELMIRSGGSSSHHDEYCLVDSAVTGTVVGGVFGAKYLVVSQKGSQTSSYTCLRLCDGCRLRILITQA